MNSPGRGSALLGVILMSLTAIGSMVAAPLAMLSFSPKSETPTSQAGDSESSSSGAESSLLPKLEWSHRLVIGADRLAKTDRKNELLFDYLGIKPPPSEIKGRIADALDSGGQTILKQVHINGVIATVSDPFDSSSNYLFDARLNILRRAISTHGYSLDRFVLPWPSDKKESKKNSASDESHPHHSEPGLLLFRRPRDTEPFSDLLLLYVVGETSSTGIHKKAFQNAVDHLEQWRSPSIAQNDEPIGILGPAFTGSADSLARAIVDNDRQGHSPLDSTPHTPPKFHVVSGGANAIDWKRFQDRVGSRAILHSTRPSAFALRKELLAFVAERHLSQHPIRVAWLVESSRFGRNASRRPNQTPAKSGPEATAFASTVPKTKDAIHPEVVEFAFPYHVSRVRKELQARQAGDSTAKLPTILPADSKLGISQSEAASPTDVTPQYSSLTPALDELQLRQTMNTIQRDGFRYVGITATDPLDTAFLAELVRAHCPNAQLLLVSGATSFLHPKQRGFLKGALLATGYPLIHETQHWNFPWGANPNTDRSAIAAKQWMLASDMDSSTGVYNATVLLLADKQRSRWSKENEFLWSKGDFDSLQLVDYGLPFVTGADTLYQPAVWISTVGQTDVIPLKVSAEEMAGDRQLVRVRIEANALTKASERQPLLRFPLSGALLIVVLVVGSALIFLIVFEIYTSKTAQPNMASHGGDNTGDQPQGWWPTFLDVVTPLLRSRDDDDLGMLFTARGKQLIALLIPSVGMLGFCVWQTWLCGAICLFEWKSFEADCGCALITTALLLGFAAMVWWLATRYRTDRFPKARIEWSSPSGGFLAAASLVVLFGAWAYGFPIGLTGAFLWNGWGFFCGTLACAICALFWFGLSLWLMYHLCRSKSRPSGKLAISLAYSVATVSPVWVCLTSNSEPGTAAIRFFQSISLTNGVSLIPPTLCLLFAISLWSGFVLRRLWLAASTQHDLPPWCRLPKQTDDNPLRTVTDRMAGTVGFIQELLTTGCHSMRRNFTAHFFLVICAGVLWLAHLSRWSAVSFDVRRVSWLVWLIGGVTVLAWLHTFWQAIALRRMIHKLLRQIAWVPPLTEAMSRLPERVRVVVGHFLDIRQRRPSYLRVRVQYAKYLAREHKDVFFAGSIPPIPEAHWSAQHLGILSVQKIESVFVEELRAVPFAIDRMPGSQRIAMENTLRHLGQFGQRVWLGLLEEWRKQPPREVFPKGEPSRDTTSQAIKQLAGDLKRDQASAAGLSAGPKAGNTIGKEEWIAAAEELAATQVLNYLRGVLSFFYGQIWFLLGITVLFVLAVMLWPLQPQRQLMSTAVAMLMAATVFCVLSLFGLERDRVHSILRGTTPDRVDFDRDIVLKLATTMAPVTLLLLSYVFPDTVHWLFSFVEPLATNR